MPGVLILRSRDPALAGPLRGAVRDALQRRFGGELRNDELRTARLGLRRVSVKMFVVSRSYTLPSTPVQVTEFAQPSAVHSIGPVAHVCGVPSDANDGIRKVTFPEAV